jgi:hypothetical protein
MGVICESWICSMCLTTTISGRGKYPMIERRKKLTIEQIRTLFPFDVPVLAQKAGVATDTLYLALQLYPIAKRDAEKIIAALAQHTGLPLSFDQLEIVMWGEYLMLWVVRASVHGLPNEFQFQSGW